MDTSRRRVSPAGWVAIGLAVLVLVALAVLWHLRGGISVEVTNQSDSPVRDVEVRTSAGTYRLGDLAPGASRGTSVGAAGESSAAVAWTTADGARRAKDADVYFEGSPESTGSYSGNLEFVIRGSEATVSGGVVPNLSPFSRSTPPRPR